MKHFSLMFNLVVLIFLIFIFKNTRAMDQGESVVCKDNAFMLKSGNYVVEFGEQTGNQILFYKQSRKGVLKYNVLGGIKEFDLAKTKNKVSCIQTTDFTVIKLKAENKLAELEVNIYQYENIPGLFHFTQQLTLKKDLPDDFVIKPELRLLKREGEHFLPVKNGDFIVGLGPRHPNYLYAKQAPYTTPVIYFCAPGWLGSSLFYFEDLSSLNDLFNASHQPAEKIMVDLVNANSSFGYIIPEGALKNLPLNKKIVIADSYLMLDEKYPRDEADAALKYLSYLSTIYDFIKKPDTELTDWNDLAKKEINDLSNKELWVKVNKHLLLRSYVSDQRKSAELITQLDVLLALSRYRRTGFADSSLIDNLTKTLPLFYSEKHKMLSNNFPLEEKGDSWYIVEELMQLAKLAKLGNKTARDVLQKSINRFIDFAQKVNYEFPNHFLYANLEPIAGFEQDVSGGYAYLMLELYDLFGEKRFLNEAKESIKRISGKYFNLNYELQMTAMGAVAAARLFKLTGDPKYLNLSYMPIANIMLVTWLWECDYGYAKSYSTFFGLSPMLHSAVITMKEQYEVWYFLLEYLEVLKGEVPEPLNKLVSEFYRYTLFVLKYSLPPLLPEEAVQLNPKAYPPVGRNDPTLYIPLEDLREGFSRSGLIGQQVYGAGGPITLAALAYKKLNDEVTIYSEYPIVEYDSTSFTLSGTPDYKVWVEITGNKLPQIYDSNRNKIKVLKIDKNKIRFKANGGQKFYLEN